MKKNFLITAVLFFATFLIADMGKPIMDYHFDTVVKSDIIKNRSGGGHDAKLVGKFRITPAKAIEFDGQTTGIVIADSGKFITQGKTMIAVVRINPQLPGSERPKRFAALFFKKKEFCFAYADNTLLFSLGTDEKKNLMVTKKLLPQTIPGFHQCAVTVARHELLEQGEIWTEVKIYFDGVLVGMKRFTEPPPINSDALLQIGQTTAGDPSFGDRMWDFEGEFSAAQIYDQVLTESQIQNLVLVDSRLKPAFKLMAKRSSADSQWLERLTGNAKTPEERAVALARRNIADSGAAFDWKTARPGEGFFLMSGPESIIVLAYSKSFAQVVSWYDTKANRELLHWDNSFFSLSFKRGDALFDVFPGDKSVNATIAAEPKLDEGKWKFSIRYCRKSDRTLPITFTALVNYSFYNDRLEYDLAVYDISAETIVRSVNFPAVKLNPLSDGVDTMLAPLLSGVEYPNASANFASFASEYPQAYCTMQFGAYYDNKGGLYFATEDPSAKAKNVTFAASRDSFNINYNWLAAYKSPSEPNHFKSHSRAAIELIRGNWYDAGLVYRRVLAEINAPWWTRSLPRKDTPQWVRDNCLWLQGVYAGSLHWEYALNTLSQLREYFGQPFALRYYRWGGKFDRDYPHGRPNPDFYTRTRDMQKLGIKVVPYINGRLWETLDRRDEDYQYSTIGRPNAVVDESGKTVLENYDGASFAVLCPATQVFFDKMAEEVLRPVIFGADGVYVDQVGASRPCLCYNQAHGHLSADNEGWYLKGHRKAFGNARKVMQEHNPDTMLCTEDLAEPIVEDFDAALPWRCMFNNQVPLYSLVYSGRIQLLGINFYTRSLKYPQGDIDAAFAKAAFQFLCSCQGTFLPEYLAAPGMSDFRVYLKQLMYLRRGLLTFFNEGMMARPAEFKIAQKSTARWWGPHGSQNVSTPPIMSASWEYDKIKAVILINTEKQAHKNTVCFNLATAENKLYSFSSHNDIKQQAVGGSPEIDFEIPPYGCQLIIAVEKGRDITSLLEKLKSEFKIIQAASQTPDPFEKNK